MAAEPDDVWAVLADGWLFGLWVVGAARMREVDEDWPAAGARLHHSVGNWPMLIDDTTSVVEVEQGRRLLLRARAWPAGEAQVELRLEETPGGTAVTMSEDAVSGPGVLVPEPLRAPLLKWRNVESLRRLALLVENRKRS
jgi:Polyketide cyclase / dehydrase and lipid transport